MASIEEKVEEHFKKILDDLHIRHFGKTEKIRVFNEIVGSNVIPESLVD